MTNKPPGRNPPESAGVNLGEIYYVLFRRKWLIIFLSLAGIAAAGLIYFLTPKLYQSDTKLLVRYILENKGFDAPSAVDQVRSPDSQGEAIINSEVEILTSLDLAQLVAGSIGPERILPEGSEHTNVISAAVFIGRRLTVTTSKNSSVIQLSFQHRDPEIARRVLQQLVDAYLRKHVEIHRAGGFLNNYLNQQCEKLRADLKGTDEALAALKNPVGMVSVEDSRRILLEQAARIRQELLGFEAELAERQALFKQVQSLPGTKTASNEVAVVRHEVPPAKVEEYRRVAAQLEGFRKREQDLLTQFNEGNSLVKQMHQLVVQTAASKEQMEKEFPGLTLVNVEPAAKSDNATNLAAEAARISALRAKIEVRLGQLKETQTNLVEIEKLEPQIAELQRQRQQQAASLRSYEASLERSMANTASGAGGVSNINVVQEASPAFPATSKLLKVAGMALAGGVGGAVALAFLIELIFRQSIRHASQIEKKLGLPLFISIPDFGRNRKGRSHKARRGDVNGRNVADSPSGSEFPGDGRKELDVQAPRNGDLAVAEWNGSHQLRSYYEALRDRLITFFEVRNMTHKPKLVAVTGCSKGAGVSSVAAGLAATLSETGDGNVLLVDMNLEHGAVHPFFRGKPAIGITDALDADDRQPAHVQENLYAASASVANDALPKALPKRFASLVPRFKASDYDYIIFDMPPVTQTSLTPRLASYMDMVLLVVESEKTNLGVADKAVELLRESRANVSAIINRKRKYVPAWLLEEF